MCRGNAHVFLLALLVAAQASVVRSQSVAYFPTNLGIEKNLASTGQISVNEHAVLEIDVSVHIKVETPNGVLADSFSCPEDIVNEATAFLLTIEELSNEHVDLGESPSAVDYPITFHWLNKNAGEFLHGSSNLTLLVPLQAAPTSHALQVERTLLVALVEEQPHRLRSIVARRFANLPTLQSHSLKEQGGSLVVSVLLHGHTTVMLDDGTCRSDQIQSRPAERSVSVGLCHVAFVTLFLSLTYWSIRVPCFNIWKNRESSPIRPEEPFTSQEHPKRAADHGDNPAQPLEELEDALQLPPRLERAVIDPSDLQGLDMESPPGGTAPSRSPGDFEVAPMINLKEAIHQVAPRGGTAAKSHPQTFNNDSQSTDSRRAEPTEISVRIDDVFSSKIKATLVSKDEPERAPSERLEERNGLGRFSRNEAVKVVGMEQIRVRRPDVEGNDNCMSAPDDSSYVSTLPSDSECASLDPSPSKKKNLRKMLESSSGKSTKGERREEESPRARKRVLAQSDGQSNLSKRARRATEESTTNAMQHAAIEDDDFYIWTNLWDRLTDSGWKYVRARNPLHDWYYIPSGHDVKGGTLGVDYFASPDEVISYAKKNDFKQLYGSSKEESEVGFSESNEPQTDIEVTVERTDCRSDVVLTTKDPTAMQSLGGGSKVSKEKEHAAETAADPSGSSFGSESSQACSFAFREVSPSQMAPSSNRDVEIAPAENKRLIELCNEMRLSSKLVTINCKGNIIELCIQWSRPSATRLPRAFGSFFPQLRKLEIRWFDNLSDISPIGGCQFLEDLELQGLPINKLPAELWSITTLQRLCLGSLDIRDLSPQIGNLAMLEILVIERCHNVRRFPPEVGLLSKLKGLYVRRCGLTELPYTIGDLNELVSVDLSDCRELSDVPLGIWKLPKLESFEASGQTALREFSFPDITEFSTSVRDLSVNRSAFELQKQSWRKMFYYADLNIAGRKLLFQEEVPEALWSNVFERCRNFTHTEVSLNVIYFFLREKPMLVNYEATTRSTKRKRRLGSA